MSRKKLKNFGGVLLSFLSSLKRFDGQEDVAHFILDDTLGISANNKWSDERLGLTKTVIYCVYGFCE